MKRHFVAFKVVRTAASYLFLLAVVYLIASACATSVYSPNYGGTWSGTVWVDSIHGSSGTLHLHAHITRANSGQTGPGQMNEDGISLFFNQSQSHTLLNGRDYFGKYYSRYSTNNYNYASGTWSVDSAFVEFDSTVVWQTKRLKVTGRELPTLYYGGDTLDFTR